MKIYKGNVWAFESVKEAREFLAQTESEVVIITTEKIPELEIPKGKILWAKDKGKRGYYLAPFYGIGGYRFIPKNKCREIQRKKGKEYEKKN